MVVVRCLCAQLTLFAHPDEKGETVEFMGKTYELQVIEDGCFDDLDIALFSAGGSISEVLACPVPAEMGTHVPPVCTRSPRSSRLPLHADLGTEGRRGWLHRCRQLVRLPHGPEHPSRRAGGECPRSRWPQRHHRQPELHHHVR